MISTHFKKNNAFTLAELLIALAILAIIATFMIPKLLVSQQNERYNAAAKETIAQVTEAYRKYQLEQTVTNSTKPSDLIPYLNYVSLNSTSWQIDDPYYGGGGSTVPLTCGTAYYQVCIKLHSGGVLAADDAEAWFNRAPKWDVIQFLLDPDGAYNKSSDASLWIIIHRNGRVETWKSWDSGHDPSWFHW